MPQHPIPATSVDPVRVKEEHASALCPCTVVLICLLVLAFVPLFLFA